MGNGYFFTTFGVNSLHGFWEVRFTDILRMSVKNKCFGENVKLTNMLHIAIPDCAFKSLY